MFSATFSKDIKKLAMGILHKPVQLKLHQKTLLLMLLLKKYILFAKKNKLIIKLITEGTGNRFWYYRTKQGANKLAEC
jgi:ATP-dependent RNA helicase RhlE